MAVRVTVDEVIEILDDTELDDDVILAFIGSANVFVTAQLSAKSLDASVLKEIERWVSAHMITMTRERVGKEAGAGGAYIKYAGEWGKGLNGTSYGQTAVMLDTTGTLEALAQGKGKASMKAIPNFD